MKRRSGRNWVEAAAESDGHVHLDEGDLVSFEIDNHYETGVFVSLLSFSRAGAIALMYPPAGARELLEPTDPGRPFTIGASKSRGIRLVREPHAIVNVETFKLVVTTYECDCWFLTQPGVQEGAIWEPPKAAVATRAGMVVSGAPLVDDWATFSATYVLTSRG
jgi:hypothetical protein